MSLEVASSYLMDQCSEHDIPPAVRGNLTDQKGHDLTLGLEAREAAVLTCWWLGTSLAVSAVRLVDPH